MYIYIYIHTHNIYIYLLPMWPSGQFLATVPEVRIRFPALPDFLRSGGSVKRSTQPRESGFDSQIF
jgi:hypothetical protein